MARLSSVFEWRPTGEVFEFAWLRFDVDAAKRIIVAAPRELVQFDVTTFVEWLGLLPIRRMIHGQLTIRGVMVDWQEADMDDVDLAVPIITAQLCDSVIPIDGWRRIAKATLLGVPELAQVLMTRAETVEVMCG